MDEDDDNPGWSSRKAKRRRNCFENEDETADCRFESSVDSMNILEDPTLPDSDTVSLIEDDTPIHSDQTVQTDPLQTPRESRSSTLRLTTNQGIAPQQCISSAASCPPQDFTSVFDESFNDMPDQLEQYTEEYRQSLDYDREGAHQRDTGIDPSHEEFERLFWDQPVSDDESTEMTCSPPRCTESPIAFPEDLPVAESQHESHHDPKEELYDGAPISVVDSFTSILSFVQSENISGAGLGRLLSLISLHLPKPNNFFPSSYNLFKLLEHQDESVTMYYFCSVCYKHRASESDLCDVCIDDTRIVNYFISFPLVPQIRRMYKRPGFVHDLKYKHWRVKQNPLNIEDIYDGELYKKAENDILSIDTNISLTWNTDGLQIYNSSSFSLWPWFFVINELPPEKRFLSENMIIAGMWGSITKPHPNIYLKPIYDEVKTLNSGIEVTYSGDEELHKVRAIVLCGTCDAPARAVFLNMKSHSGYYPCHVCVLKGEKSPRTSDVTVFPYADNVPLRNMDEYKEQVAWAVHNRVLHNPLLQNSEECKGIKGPTLLSSIVYGEDMFASTAIDSMHNCYLGVMRQMLHLWFDHANRAEPFSIYSETKTVSQRMLQMTPPHFIQRFPQTIEKLIYWKATELRAFLFCLSLCVLHGILKVEYFDHFLLFVGGLSLLNTSSVSHDDLQVSSFLLRQFVVQFEGLYGVRHMSYPFTSRCPFKRT